MYIYVTSELPNETVFNFSNLKTWRRQCLKSLLYFVLIPTVCFFESEAASELVTTARASIWKHTTSCDKGVFSVVLISQLQWPIELKLSQVCYFMHMLGYKRMYTRWEYGLWQLSKVSSAFEVIKNCLKYKVEQWANVNNCKQWANVNNCTWCWVNTCNKCKENTFLHEL